MESFDPTLHRINGSAITLAADLAEIVHGVPTTVHLAWSDGAGVVRWTGPWDELPAALAGHAGLHALELAAVWTAEAVHTVTFTPGAPGTVVTVPLAPAGGVLHTGIAELRRLHVSSAETRGVGRYHPDKPGNWTPYCDECHEDWPCTTAALLNPALTVDA